MIVRISLKFRQRFRYFNSSLTKFERIVWRNFDECFLWQNVVAKRFATTFCHKKKSSKFRQRFRCFNSSSDEILTKFWRKNLWQNLVAKRFATKHPTKSLTKFWRNENEGKNKEHPYTRTYCKWQEIMVEFDPNVLCIIYIINIIYYIYYILYIIYIIIYIYLYYIYIIIYIYDLYII